MVVTSQNGDASQYKSAEGQLPEKGNDIASLTLGDLAYTTISDQYQRIIKREQKVLADKNPEHLHQMRVGIRRLRTALHVFDQVVELPKAASDRRLRTLARTLGRLRDLDVQIATLREDYQPRLSQPEQNWLNQGIAVLQKQRRKAFAGTEASLTDTTYHDLKSAYTTWLDKPKFKPPARFPLLVALPDLLSPLVSKLLLHPAWLIAKADISPDNSPTLHDLRKLCKQVRYQAEFFAEFYGEAFQTWIDQIKDLQERLGKVQDGQVLLDLLTDELPQSTVMPELHATIHQERDTALQTWDDLRQDYLNPQFRRQLYQLLLEPVEVTTPSAKLQVDD
ncbi:CHAD domain-containing protein [Oscillatoria sp. FACHB-1407]|uniref:CHAD domain-containing protein n=1 Tax=Oscillatoria sp. FACHB-1407 TaxID=2692847 RepID=UPI00168722CE|nr:CHAD domain-containing protein [Oscillatoria sp. FACHB-1407]MBD2463285.1 CHAD domain-containing protein [Oscillatoria sp. FACHB-1407]